MLLSCAAFDETVQVPTNLVAETPELRKKVNRLLGTAGPRRAALIVARAKDKQKSASKLSYMDSPIGPETQPQPVMSRASSLIIPPPVLPPLSPSSQSSEELVVRIGFKLLYRLLTITFSLGGCFRKKRKAAFVAAEGSTAQKASRAPSLSQPQPASVKVTRARPLSSQVRPLNLTHDCR